MLYPSRISDIGASDVWVRLAVLVSVLASWTPLGRGPAGAQINDQGKLSVDASFVIPSEPSQVRITIDFYHRGPFSSVHEGQPDEYIKGITVRDDEKIRAESHVLANWEAPATTIVTFYPELSRVWTVARPREVIVTTAVQYGGRALTLYAFAWDKGRLQPIQQWSGENFSIARMGVPWRLVVTVMPPDYNRIPQLYAWNGSAFVPADRQFPNYFRLLGEREAASIFHFKESLPPAALVQSCRRVLQAYTLAGDRAPGREACLQARARIESASRARGPEVQQERKSAIAEINRLLEGVEGARP